MQFIPLDIITLPFEELITAVEYHIAEVILLLIILFAVTAILFKFFVPKKERPQSSGSDGIAIPSQEEEQGQ